MALKSGKIMRKLVLAVILIGLGIGLVYFWAATGGSVCGVCQRPLHSVTSYRIHLSSDQVVEVCCPRCGLHFQNSRSEVIESEVADFESGVLLPAEEATYVVGSDVHLCCSIERLREDRAGGQYVLSWDRCLPSIVAFKNPDRAKAFQSKRGGYLSTYRELVTESVPGNASLN